MVCVFLMKRWCVEHKIVHESCLLSDRIIFLLFMINRVEFSTQLMREICNSVLVSLIYIALDNLI